MEICPLGITSLVVCGERLEFERRGKGQKTRRSSFLRKDQISLLFVLFHDAWQCLKAPALQKGLKGPFLHSVEWCHSDYLCLKYTFFLSFLADLCPWYLSFPEVSFSPAQPGADASRKGSRAHSETGILLSPKTSSQKQTLKNKKLFSF